MREKLDKFMKGRYGVDHFSQFMVFAAMVLMLLQLFIPSLIADLVLNVAAVGLLFYTYFRIFSRNHYQRYEENKRYLRIRDEVKNFIRLKKGGRRRDANYRIFKCPNCKQSIRVPKGKGKIAITCPKCKTEFIKRS